MKLLKRGQRRRSVSTAGPRQSSKRNIVLGALLVIAMAAASVVISGQSGGGVQSLPLLQQSGLIYLGSFRLPISAGPLSDFQYGGQSLAFNPANNSLFVQGRDNFVAEIGIPALVKSSTYTSLPVGAVIQPFAAIDDQSLRLAYSPADTSIRGLLVDRGQIIVSFASYYDANYLQQRSHFTRPLNLSTTGQGKGPFKVGTVMPGHVAGHMSLIPADWQMLFGGRALTGNFGLPIVTRESFGPAAFVFDPAQLGLITPAPGTAVLDYPDAGHSLGQWDGQNNLWNSNSTFAGMAFIEGTRSVLFMGSHGTGPYCYGEGSAVNPNNGEPWCYDPEIGNKGGHTYPYVYRIWAYDANDLVAVKQGRKQAWEPRPYGVWDLNLPMTAAWHKMPSAAHDPASGRLFIVQSFGATDAAAGYPVVHVYSAGAQKPATPQQVHLFLQ